MGSTKPFPLSTSRPLCPPRVQVQNKLDGCYYAAKRIQVNPASKQFRRIKGEVTLLSRLNHENIVRYYNAWIERHEMPSTGVVSNTDSSETQSPLDKQTPQGGKKAALRLNELGLPDDAEDLAPPLALSSSVEWSTSIEKSSSARCSGQRSSDEEDDDDDEDVFGASFLYVFLLVFYSFLSDLCKIDFIFFHPSRPSDSDSRSDIIFDNGDESADEMSQVCARYFGRHLVCSLHSDVTWLLLCPCAGRVEQKAGGQHHGEHGLGKTPSHCTLPVHTSKQWWQKYLHSVFQ